MSTVPCLDENTVLQYLEGLLDSDRALQVEQHIAVCEDCRWLISMSAVTDSDEGSTMAATRQLEQQGNDPMPSSPGAPPALAQEVLHETYIIERFIGKGGMGAVFEASHVTLPRRFAIKFLSDSCSANPKAVARLKREAEVTSKLAHRHIVQVIDFKHTPQGAPFIVMELLAGEPLSSRLARDGRFTELGEVASIVRQTASALAAAHREGIVHRDLKPTNIFLCRTEEQTPFVKVMDFGISKVMGQQSSLTGDISVMGSPGYMAPEQASGQSAEVDQRADIFGMGAIIFEMLTGHPPFEGQSVPATLFKVVYEGPAKPEIWELLPKPLQRVVLKALHKEPDKRHQSMSQLWQEFAQALHASGLAGAVDTALSGPHEAFADATMESVGWTWSPLRSNKRLFRLSALAAVIALASVLVIVYLISGQDGEPIDTTDQIALFVPDSFPSPHGAAPPLPDAAPPPPDAAPPLPDAAPPPTDAAPPPPDDAAATPADASHAPSLPRRRPRGRPIHSPTRLFGKLTVQTKAKIDGKYIWADVFLDGKKVGQTALTLNRVPAGRHRITVAREGYGRVSRQILIKPGRRQHVSVVLQRVKQIGRNGKR